MSRLHLILDESSLAASGTGFVSVLYLQVDAGWERAEADAPATTRPVRSPTAQPKHWSPWRLRHSECPADDRCYPCNGLLGDGDSRPKPGRYPPRVVRVLVSLTAPLVDASCSFYRNPDLHHHTRLYLLFCLFSFLNLPPQAQAHPASHSFGCRRGSSSSSQSWDFGDPDIRLDSLLLSPVRAPLLSSSSLSPLFIFHGRL